MPETIFIRTKKSTVYIYAGISFCICLISLFLYFDGIAEELFAKMLCWIAAVISGLFFLVLLPVIKADTGIILDSTGITDCTRLKKIGPVPWRDIISFEKKEINIEMRRSGKLTGNTIKRRYIAAKIRPESPFGAIIAEINNNIMPGGGGNEILNDTGKETLIINPTMLKCDEEKLFAMLAEMHKNNGTLKK